MAPEFDMKKVTTPLRLHMLLLGGRIADGKPECNFVWELHQRPNSSSETRHV